MNNKIYYGRNNETDGNSNFTLANNFHHIYQKLTNSSPGNSLFHR